MHCGSVIPKIPVMGQEHVSHKEVQPHTFPRDLNMFELKKQLHTASTSPEQSLQRLMKSLIESEHVLAM